MQCPYCNAETQAEPFPDGGTLETCLCCGWHEAETFAPAEAWYSYFIWLDYEAEEATEIEEPAYTLHPSYLPY